MDNLYLTGFMGAGKSTVGAGLARVLGRAFVDLDELIARRLGMSATEAFSCLGEGAFRAAEVEELTNVAEGIRLVVAVGGGVPQNPANRLLMRGSGRIVHLDVSLEACRRRLGWAGAVIRPLWTDDEALAELYDQRRPTYDDCDLSLCTDGLSSREVVDALCAKLMPECSMEVTLGDAVCPIIATWDGPEVLRGFLAKRRAALLCDHNVVALHGERYASALGSPVRITVSPGEESKSLEASGRVYEELLQAHVERGDLMVALGGGVVTDLGAYVAATYKRGIDFALVSTSLLGCVDAAVGGKAALNMNQAKNVIGLFTTPVAVVLDLRALSTVPSAQISEGLVEAYKTGLVADPELAALIEGAPEACGAGDLLLLAEVAVRSAQAKAWVVSRDFREAGLRRVLNFGHTYGHAVEGFHRYRVSHGRAVAVGMRVAAELSVGRGLLSVAAAERIAATLSSIVTTEFTWPGEREAWPFMAHDKKNQRGRVLFVLLTDAGDAPVVDDVTPEELSRAIARARERERGG